MTNLSKRLSALAIALSMTSGYTLAGARSAPHAAREPVRDRDFDFGKASALAPHHRLQPAPSVSPPETDGLGRNDEDCRFGCIDH